MAAPARITTWAAGDTLTASALNAEFTNLINALTDGTMDITISSLALATLTASGAATFNGNVTLGNALADAITITGQVKGDEIAFTGVENPGWICNLGLTLAAGVLTVTGSDGTALSASNRGYVCMAGATAGQTEIIKITSGGVLKDDNHASSDLTNNGWGITEAAAWANDVPFFLYLVNRSDGDVDGADGTSAFAIARNFAMSVTPSAANNIGNTATAPVTDDQTSIMLLGDSYTVANYTSKPCQLIGAIRMQWSTITDDWTVQTLGNNDGMGQEQIRKTFATIWTMPLAQNGANASSYIRLNSGTTVPAFTTQNYAYRLAPTGIVTCNVLLTGDAGDNGSGAVTAQFVLPTTSYALGFTGEFHVGYLRAAGLNAGAFELYVYQVPSAVSYFVAGTAAGVDVTLNDFGNGNRDVECTISYKAY